jgi:hypothetical protein
MAKPKRSKATKAKASVPCVRIVIGGKPGRGQADARGCTVVGATHGAVTKFDLGRKYGATSKSVSTPKTNKPCLGSLKRKGCPVQLAFDNGQPFLRLCTVEKQPGYRLDVASPAEAQAKATEVCATWKRTGKFELPSTTPLGRTRRR